MYRVRLALGVILTLSWLATPLLLAEEAASESKSPTPLQVLEDCFGAVQSRDFARYVDHLSPAEQQLQAGFALFVANLMSQSADSWEDTTDPQSILLGQALKDLVRQHSLIGPPDDEAYRHASQARDQMVGQLYTASVTAPGGAPSGFGAHHVMMPPVLRQTCRTSAGVLKDHRQFLIAVLTEASRPTTVTGEQRKESKPTFDFDNYAKGFSEVKWTIYTRGDYAIAVMATTDTGSQPLAPAPAQLQPAGPMQVRQAAIQMSVGFRRIDGVWKIDRLLPTSVLRPQPVPGVTPY